MPQFEVTVELKREVLDPEGRAIRNSLTRLGFESVKDVKVTRRYVVEMENDSQETVDKIADEYLANPVSETFTIRKL